MKNSIVFKIAEFDFEFEKINQLNYETFVEEIPQHKDNKEKTLKDKFDNENIYFIALRDQKLLGMLAIRDKRPFSLDQKIENLDTYLPSAKSICEIRLLSVRKENRNGFILKGLIKELMKYIKEKGYDMALISGILNQQKLYKHIGFIPFGPIVGKGEAKFQPMYIIKENHNVTKLLENEEEISFLPGPVEISKKVRTAFTKRPLSHRASDFKNMFFNLKKMLCDLVNSKYVEIFIGSGTLANDIICAQLSLLEKRGLILSNGEFGERLIDHANRFRLKFKEYSIDWGKTFDLDKIEKLLNENKDIGWIYMLHCETSTGILNEIKEISKICQKNHVHLCVDAISSIGNIEVDLSHIYLASCVSGKGLASYCGLSMVFYNHELLPHENNLPRYLDLYRYKKEQGIPYTISSNLVDALHTSLRYLNKKEKFKKIEEINQYFRMELKRIGIKPLVEHNIGISCIITIPIPLEYSSKEIGDILKNKGYLISYESAYLIKRNWIQLAFMGAVEKENLNPIIRILEEMKI